MNNAHERLPEERHSDASSGTAAQRQVDHAIGSIGATVADASRTPGARARRPIDKRLLLSLSAALFAVYFAAAMYLDRTFVDPTPKGELVVRLPRPFERYNLAAVAFPGKMNTESDDPAVDGDRTSRVVLFEDTRRLGPPHVGFGEIDKLGGGRFSHLPNGIVFSSSDGSDPNTNHRNYWAVVPFEVKPKADHVVRLMGPFERYALASVARPHNLDAEADDPAVEGDRTSRVVVYEDDRPLGPGHAGFGEIDTWGGGRFSHLPGGIVFSTSDGSDPNTNGHTYWAVVRPPPKKPVGHEGQQIVELTGPFERYKLASVAHPRKLDAEPDNPAVERDLTSKLMVYEEDRLLGPAHASFNEINTLGGGRYSHLPSGITFSTTDGSDPNTNGRTYWAVAPPPPKAPEGHKVVQLTRPFERYRLASVAIGDLSGKLEVKADNPTIEGDHSSPVVIYENDRPLGPGHESFNDINNLGGGRYSHLPSGITFSSSDGTDPNTNGRTYWAVVP